MSEKITSGVSADLMPFLDMPSPVDMGPIEATATVLANPAIVIRFHDIAALVQGIKDVHAAFAGLAQTDTPAEAPPAPLEPAVPIKKSVTPDYIICLEDGKKFKSLKRHIRTHYNLTPEQYREKWGLSDDYPMVSANYSATRSRLAKDNGLGKKS